MEGRVRNRQEMRLVLSWTEGERVIEVGEEEKRGGPWLSDERIGVKKGFLQWQERTCVLSENAGG